MHLITPSLVQTYLGISVAFFSLRNLKNKVFRVLVSSSLIKSPFGLVVLKVFWSSYLVARSATRILSGRLSRVSEGALPTL